MLTLAELSIPYSLFCKVWGFCVSREKLKAGSEGQKYLKIIKISDKYISMAITTCM